MFFWISKLAWLFVAPDTLLLLLILLTGFALQSRHQRLAIRLHATLAILCLLLALFPVGEWLLAPLETRFATNPELPAAIDGIVVLGGAEEAQLTALWDQVEVNDSAERNLAFVQLARRYPEARLVFTGGSSSMVNQHHKGADVTQKLFHDLGLDTTRILFERESRNTYENAIFSKKLATPKAGEKWLLITTAWHMPRSLGIFCRAGWPMTPYPVDHRTSPGNLFRLELDFAGHLDTTRIAAREWLGLLAYRLTGKTTSLLPGRCEQELH